MELRILHGDNIDLLKQYPDNYFDSVVTDCPYGLSKEPNAINLIKDWIDHGYHEIKGSGFMGKKWDAFVPQPKFWKEVFRVLKPGGYVVAFFGTRTYDWGTLAIRLAGFEIRDMITWMYGSGFPKSLNISKQLDKMAGAEREIIGKSRYEGRRPNSFGGNKNGNSTYGDFNAQPEMPITAPSTDEAKKWDGWGTALKPASEPICIARKPIEKGLSVADNILKYGTGGINIGECLIEFESEEDYKSATYGTGTNIIGGNYVGSKLTDGRKNIEANPDGRFPSNVILDPFMAVQLDEQTGQLTSGKPSGVRKAKNNIYGQYAQGQEITGFGDTGGASRFFYCAKASQYERHLGCDEIGAATTTDGRYLVNDPAYQRGANERTNSHPTVKPIALIRYLQRLVTPKGGKTLDPFAGSGTAGCSAYFEDIGECVLMELDDAGTYIAIIEARTKYFSSEINRINYLSDIKSVKEEQPENQLKMFQ